MIRSFARGRVARGVGISRGVWPERFSGRVGWEGRI